MGYEGPTTPLELVHQISGFQGFQVRFLGFQGFQDGFRDEFQGLQGFENLKSSLGSGPDFKESNPNRISGISALSSRVS